MDEEGLPTVEETVKEFRKAELLKLARELGLKSITSRSRALGIIEALWDDMDENGIPDPDDEDTSDLMYEFMSYSGYLDDEENEEGGDESEQEQREQTEPDCFGFADRADPACKKCSRTDDCYEKRVAGRPECFGKLYNADSEECGSCLEANPCRKSTK